MYVSSSPPIQTLVKDTSVDLEDDDHDDDHKDHDDNEDDIIDDDYDVHHHQSRDNHVKHLSNVSSPPIQTLVKDTSVDCDDDDDDHVVDGGNGSGDNSHRDGV